MLVYHCLRLVSTGPLVSSNCGTDKQLIFMESDTVIPPLVFVRGKTAEVAPVLQVRLGFACTWAETGILRVTPYSFSASAPLMLIGSK